MASVTPDDRRRSGKRGNNEGSVYFQSKRQRWCAAISLDGGKRRWLYGKTRKEVADKLTVALRDVQQGLPLPGDKQSLEGYLADWLANTIKPGRRAGTHLLYSSAIRLHVNPLIGKTPLAKVTPQQVQKLQSALLAKGLGVKRIKLIRACLSAALAQAVKWNMLVRNPVPLVESPKEEDDEPLPLTPEQAGCLIDAARGHEFEQLYTIMLATGLRISEALGLSWSAVELDTRRLHVRQQITIIPGQAWHMSPPKSKTGKRSVPLIPAAITALQAQQTRVLEYRRTSPMPWPIHDLVFCDPLGEPIVGRRVERVFKQHLRKAGLPTTFTPHSLRHSTGTYLTAMRVPDRVVMQLLGHSSPDMTRRYQHVMEGMLEDAGEQLALIFPVASSM